MTRGAACRTQDATQGVDIKGNTELKAKQEDVTASAKGKGSVAKNQASVIEAGVSIRGNTKIEGSQAKTTATSGGR